MRCGERGLFEWMTIMLFVFVLVAVVIVSFSIIPYLVWKSPVPVLVGATLGTVVAMFGSWYVIKKFK